MDAVAGRIHVDAPQNVVTRIENGEREPGTIEEVSGVPLQVGAVLGQAHLSGPVHSLVEARGTSDVVDARHPRAVVALVVLRPERLETKLAHGEPGWRVETGRHER